LQECYQAYGDMLTHTRQYQMSRRYFADELNRIVYDLNCKIFATVCLQTLYRRT